MLKVLIADDSILIRERLRELISGVAGTEIVGEATNGPETLAALGQLKPDVLILDIQMPEGNGIKALETIKNQRIAPVVIMLTAFPYPQYRKKCLEAGAEYFFDKSTEFKRVAEVLAELGHRQQGATVRE